MSSENNDNEVIKTKYRESKDKVSISEYNPVTRETTTREEPVYKEWVQNPRPLTSSTNKLPIRSNVLNASVKKEDNNEKDSNEGETK